MSKATCSIVLSAAALVMLTTLVDAHHSDTMFDAQKEITVEGVVKEFQYTNPHSWLLVNVTNQDGSVTVWGFEAEGPSTLMQMKVRKGDFTPGTRLTISGRPMRDGRPAAMWTKAVRADGLEFYPRGRGGPEGR
jgi:DNA/RNA endonuclease YhcR with UshA esterase domain